MAVVEPSSVLALHLHRRQISVALEVVAGDAAVLQGATERHDIPVPVVGHLGIGRGLVAVGPNTPVKLEL